VYVAEGSYTNYFECPECYDLAAEIFGHTIPVFRGWASVGGSSNGRVVEPNIDLIIQPNTDAPDNPHRWLSFPGRWGGETGVHENIPAARSPEPPRHQVMWQSPSNWANEGGESKQRLWDDVDRCGVFPCIRIFGLSPIQIQVFDSRGQLPGPDRASYLDDPKTGIKAVFIPEADLADEYRIEIESTVEGTRFETFDLVILAPDGMAEEDWPVRPGLGSGLAEG